MRPELSRSDQIRIVLIVTGIIATTLAHYWTPSSLVLWHNIFQRLYYLPIILAAISYGWIGGLAAASFAGLCYVPHILMAWHEFPGYVINQYAEIAVYFMVGILTGLLSDQQRKQKETLEKTAEQLGRVYQELQESIEQLRRADRLSAVGQLSASLAHEIRNPLASIEGAAGILERGQVNDEQRAEFLRIIRRECLRLNRLLSNLLDFARPRPPQLRTVEVGQLLASVIGLVAHTAGENSVTLRKNIPAAGLNLECDAEQLKQVILNLTLNAIQAMPSGGEVVLAAHPQDKNVAIQVIDQGIGINAEDMDKIFNPFFTTKESGTGLGLSVAYQIVNQHGGAVKAQKNTGKGMTFSVLLPQHPARIC
jgi:two-component system sensor histidine kinase HydH